MMLMATALPSTSARSQAPMAISQNNQLGHRVQRGYQSRQHWARSFPVTTPKRAEMTCMKMAIMLASADHPEKSEFELRAALQIGAPIAGVHVADTDEDGRPDERPPLRPEAGLMRRHLHAAVHAFNRKAAGMRNHRDFLAGWFPEVRRCLVLFLHKVFVIPQN